MPQFQTNTVNQVQEYRPPCSRCGAPTALARVTPIPNADHDSRVFQCPVCGKIDMALVELK